MNKREQKVRVYGLDSTKKVRARLIEILMERVMYHKDKFVAPILHEEMKAMEVKKNGKVEHSDKTHDDQVFSYLMALYVWYDGKNLMENFGIRKGSIKTDADEDLEEVGLEDALEKHEKVDFNSSTFEDKTEISQELEWIEKDLAKFKTTADLAEEQYFEKINKRNMILSTDPRIRQQDMENNPDGINTVTLNYASNHMAGYSPMTSLPMNIFDMMNDTDYDDEYGLFDDEEGTNMRQDRSYLQGNLSSMYDLL